jgi:hypothetical protein
MREALPERNEFAGFIVLPKDIDLSPALLSTEQPRT